ncbi:MAG: PDZ domain-containing protein [Chloroflexaceae bacterium]|nr:PDZ domain-containing protein [Chloroflexaceae bacterium]
MSKSTQIGLIFLILLAVFVSITGGALVGGVTGYFLAQQSIAEMPTPEVQTVVQPAEPAQPETPAEPAPEIFPDPTQPPEAVIPPVVGDAEEQSDAMVLAVERVSPAVVTVLNINSEAGGSGSGVIVSENGYILTNHHVVEGATELAVIFADGTRQDVTLVGSDPLSDVAVVKATEAVPAVAVVGESDALQPGETVLAIGSPLGNFRNTVTSGVVSALNRSVGNLEGLIQTDASINRGNSGGPLINLEGEVVGLNTLVVRGGFLGSDQAEGLGFAVPSTIFRRVSEQLVATGEMAYPYLGIQYQVIDWDVVVEENLPVENGALVISVEPGTPADQAGLQDGDIITALDSTSLAQDNSLRYVLIQYQPGDTVELTVLRDGRELQLELTLGTRPKDLQP